MKQYRIKDIKNLSTGKSRTERMYPNWIGRIVKEPHVFMDTAIVECLQPEQYLHTSMVKSLDTDINGNITILTLNSIYELEYLGDNL